MFTSIIYERTVYRLYPVNLRLNSSWCFIDTKINNKPFKSAISKTYKYMQTDNPTVVLITPSVKDIIVLYNNYKKSSHCRKIKNEFPNVHIAFYARLY